MATRSRGWDCVLAAVAAVILTAGLVVRGQEGVAKASPDDQKELVEAGGGRSPRIRSSRTPSRRRADVEVRAGPRCTNPVRRPTVGLVFLWPNRGRPAAVSSFYRVRFEDRLIERDEFVSLAPVGLTADLHGRTVGAPGPGLDPRPIPGAPRPAATPDERRASSAAWAASFTSPSTSTPGPPSFGSFPSPSRFAEGDANATADKNGASRPSDGALRPSDGALFGFVMATDPEAWLVIDERSGPGAPPGTTPSRGCRTGASPPATATSLSGKPPATATPITPQALLCPLGRRAHAVNPDHDPHIQLVLQVGPETCFKGRGRDERHASMRGALSSAAGADSVPRASRTSPSPSASVDLAHLRPVRGRIGRATRSTSSEPEAEGELSPSLPAVYEALANVT